MVRYMARAAGRRAFAGLGGQHGAGGVALGTYEFTDYATLQRWSLAQVVIDLIWGTALTGFAAWAGIAAVGGKLS